jgi:hypothetical protein
MGDVVLSLLPLILSAALVPAPIFVLLVLFRGPRGFAAAAAFTAGVTSVRLAQGALFLFVFADAVAARGSDGPGTIAATLLLVLGIFLWTTAVRTLLKAEDPDAPPPAWLGKLKTASPVAAFAIGAGLIAVAAKQWVFTMAALGVIGEASLDRTGIVAAYLIFVLGAEALLLPPLVAYAVAREPAAAMVERAGTWLEGNTRPVKIVVSVVFGTYFLWKGISGLL